MSGWRSWLSFEVELLRYDPKEWLVLSGDRLLVSLLLVALLAAIVGLAVAGGYIPLVRETPVLFLLFALIAANFTLIAIVTSLGQFILSQRLESPGEIRTKIDETIAYREDVAETIDQPILPVKPDTFFQLLFESARDDLEDLRMAIPAEQTTATRTEVEELIDEVHAHAAQVADLLGHPASEMKHALFVSINTSYENHVRRAWYLQREYADEFADRLTDPLARLIDTLEHIVVASRIFEAAFIESEVAELARYLLYVGLPVQAVAMLVMLLYTAPLEAFPLSSRTTAILVPAVMVAGFTPFIILAAYIVRLTVVARRTSDTFPFSSQLTRSVALRDEFMTDGAPPPSEGQTSTDNRR